MRKTCLVALLAAAAWCASAGSRATGLDIRIDGLFDDWNGVPSAYTDTAGDGASGGIDFGRVWLADNRDFLYIRFELRKQISIQTGNGLVLYLDTDNSRETGLPVGDMGADFSWRFGERAGFLQRGDEAIPFNAYDAGLVTAPTVTSTQFEIELRKEATVGDGTKLFPSPAIRWALRDESEKAGDMAPDGKKSCSYRFTDAPVAPYPPITIGKESTDHLRVLTYNVYEDNIFKEQDAFSRILKALSPDIINLQEVRRHGRDELIALVSRMTGAAWHGVGRFDCYTLSRYPIMGTVYLKGAVGSLINLPDERCATDIFIINAHLLSGGRNEGRQKQADAIAELVNEAKKPGGRISLSPDTPIVIVGDLNLVGFARQLDTLLTGDIENEDEFGKGGPPDWDSTPMTAVMPYHVAAPEAYTWSQRDRKGYSPGRLDYVIYADSVVSPVKSFVLRTESMPEADLKASGLRREDTSTASDHLPVVADFVIKKPTSRNPDNR